MIPLLLAVLLTSITGRYEAPGATLELHVGHDGALRGHLIDGRRIAALAPVTIEGNTLTAEAIYDDEARATLKGTVADGVIRMNDKRFMRRAVERPASARVRREIFAAYERLAEAVDTKDHPKFQALRVDDFATIPPDNSPPRNAEFMAARSANLLNVIQPPIRTRNDILTLTVRGDEAIATVRQFFSRQQVSREGVLRKVETEVTQRETWRRTKDGWKLTFVDEVRDAVRR